MKLTLQFDDDLLARVKTMAADTNRTISQVVHDALSTALALHGQEIAGKAIELHTCGGLGLQRGVNLISNSAVEDIMNCSDAEKS